MGRHDPARGAAPILDHARAFSRSNLEWSRTREIHGCLRTGGALQPWHENIAKRQVRSPKIYLRDSGLLHHLLRTARIEDLEAHPKVGASWEGFALEQTLHLTGAQDAYFWATHGGAELDLLLLRGNRRIGFEFKLSTTPSMTKSMHVATADLGLNHLVVVHPGEESYAWNDHAEAVSIKALPGRIAAIL
jgi:uncharacterized protein